MTNSVASVYVQSISEHLLDAGVVIRYQIVKDTNVNEKVKLVPCNVG